MIGYTAPMIAVALKEWQITCNLLLRGELAFLLRKGGIHERSGPGAFELDHPRFALFPATEHQQPQMLKPPYREEASVDPGPPRQITFRGYGAAAGIRVVPSRQAFDQLDDLHPWAKAQIDMRFDYRSENPLYLVAVRAYRLVEAKTIAYRPAFAGCHSWVPLNADEAVDPTEATPAMDDAAFARIVDRIEAAVG